MQTTNKRHIALVLSAAACAALVSAQQNQQATTFYPKTLPTRLQLGGNFIGRIRAGFQEGRVSWEPCKTGVTIYWTSSSLTNSEPNWATYSDPVSLGDNARGDEQYKTSSQEITTAFYVTAVGRLDPTALLVAGVKKYGGQSVIQRWTFVWPSLMPSPTVNPESGLSSVDIVYPGIQKATLYSSPQLNGDFSTLVSGICGLRGTSGESSGKALVQFQSPNDVKQFDLTTGAWTLLASEANPTGLLGVVPTLSIKEYSGIGIYNHITDGYIYFLGTGSSGVSAFYGGANLDDDDQRLHLVDGNRDGEIDNVLEMSTNDARVGGFLTLGAYENWWLE